MKVVLSSWGGFAAGVAPRGAKSLDEKQLDPDAAARLRTLARQVMDAGNRSSSGPPVRDGRSYELRFEHEDGTVVAVEQTDGAVTQDFADLMQLIREHHA